MPVKGERIGPYQVLGPLGAGGMGEVYRARDTNLGRDVALKVLPGAVAGDPERLARFEREARTLASLNHPNIAAIYGLEQSAAGPVLVMEFVEGRSLDEVVKRLSPNEALPIARQMAEALEAAHDQGIIHRDLKPANVMVRDDGTVKVLDFGLAKALDSARAGAREPQIGVTSAGSTSTEHGAPGTSTAHRARSTAHETPTMTSPAMTAQGVILGTASYMAPEQARGRPVDRRADIWSFGVVLYELLAREQLFGGESMADVLAAVMTREPDLNKLPPETSPAVRALLGRCLERDPKQRLQSIGEARIVLSSPQTLVPAPPERAGVTASRLTPAGWAGVAAGLLAALAAGIGMGSWAGARSEPASSPAVRKLDVAVDRLEATDGAAPVLSPDGTKMLFRAANTLWVRDLASLAAVALPSSADARFPSWSYDSRSVLYARLADQIWSSPADGGPPIALGPTPSDLGGSGGLVSTADGRIIVSGAPGAGLSVMPATGGATSVLVPLDPAREADFHEISLLPDGQRVLFVPHTSDGIDTIEAFDGQARKVVFEVPGDEIRYPVYAHGYLVFERRRLNAGIWAVKFSLDRLEADGAPFLVAAEASLPSVSVDGTLAFVRRSDVVNDLVWVDRDGTIVSVAPLLEYAEAPALSHDGRRAALVMGQGRDVWTCDLSTGATSRITVDAGAFGPRWTPDSARLLFGAFMSTPDINLFSVRADGTGGVTRLTTRDATQLPLDITSDGRTLVLVELTEREQLHRMPVDGSSPPQPLFQTPFVEWWGSLSPDGRWLAYQSNESGRPEVSIRPMEPGAARVPVSTDGGTWPNWSADGREVFYWQGGTMMAAPVTVRQDDVIVGRPAHLFDRLPEAGLREEFDVTTDGKRFLMIRRRGNERITLVLNWPAEADELQKTR